MASDNLKFEWHGGDVLTNMSYAIEAAITAGALIAEGQIKQLTPVDSGGLRDSVTHEVEKRGGQIVGEVGSALDYAIYQEFGTGEFAENGSGRKGGWAYRASDGTRHFTFGNKPQRMFRNGYQKSKSRIIRAIQARMGEFKG